MNLLKEPQLSTGTYLRLQCLEIDLGKVALRNPLSNVYYGWIIVAVIGLAGIAQSFEAHPALGVFVKPMTEHFGWTRSQFTGALALGTVLGGAISLGIGPLLDRYGARGILTVGLTLLGTFLVLMSTITTLWQFYVIQIVARALNMGVISLAFQVTIPKWFIQRRGRAVAISGLGVLMGNAITPPILQFMISSASWREAAVTAGIIVWTISVLPVALFVRRNPEDLGLKPDGRSEDSTQQQFDPASRSEDISFSTKQVIRLSSFYFLILAYGLVFFITPGLLFHTIPFLSDQGLTPEAAVTAMAVTSIGAGLGSLAFGFLAERVNPRYLLAVDILCLGASSVILLAVRSTLNAVIWGLFMGSAQGGMFTLQQVILADFYGRRSLGAIRGIVWTVQMWANAAGPLIAAIAYDMTGSYDRIFILFGLLSIISTSSILLAKPPVQVKSEKILSQPK